MIKKFVFILFFSISGLSFANFFDDIYHAASHQVHVFTHHDVPVVVHQVRHQSDVLANKDVPIAIHVVKHQSDIVANKVLKPACKALIKGVAGKVIGKGCTTAFIDFESDCNAALDAETEGMAAAACAAGGVVIKQSCKVTLTQAVADLTQNAVCGKD